jgi:excisionase family DNA binding protein
MTNQPNPSVGRLLSINEAAATLGITPRHLARLLAQGEFPTVRIGARKLLRDLDVQAYIERHLEAPNSAQGE